MSQRITFSHGLAFPTPAIILAVVLLLIGFISLFGNVYLGFALILISAYIISNTTGLEIDQVNQAVREYTSYFGIKMGEWKNLDDYPYVSVLKGSSGYKAYSRGQLTTTVKDKSYDAYLLSKSHRSRLLVKSFQQEDKAQQAVDSLRAAMTIEQVEYKPVVSAKTRARRR